jgi:CTP synthase (UTP-ammonia lyase)
MISTHICVRQINFLFNFFAVVPHITDAIQEWVEKVANQPVTEDGAKPQVRGDDCCSLSLLSCI